MRLLVLDRDGVINEESAGFVKTPAEWIAIPGSLDAIARAAQAGFRVFVVSNQSGIARGLVSIENLHRIHAHMLAEIDHAGGHVEAILYCPHGPRQGCACRKPRPGLLNCVLERSGVAATDVIFIGDRASDLAAARAAGVRGILVETGHGRATVEAAGGTLDCAVYPDLAAAIDSLGGIAS